MNVWIYCTANTYTYIYIYIFKYILHTSLHTSAFLEPMQAFGLIFFLLLEREWETNKPTLIEKCFMCYKFVSAKEKKKKYVVGGKVWPYCKCIYDSLHEPNYATDELQITVPWYYRIYFSFKV